jgi:hypothetical protein
LFPSNDKQYLTPDITPAHPSHLDFSEPLTFKNDAHECVVEEMAADKGNLSQPPEQPIAEPQPNLDQHRVNLGLSASVIKKALDSSMTCN